MDGLLRGSHAIAAGIVTRAQFRSSMWRRLFRDVYVRSDVELSHRVWCRAAALIMPADGVISGRSAASLYGVAVSATNTPVEVTAAEHMRDRPGIRIHRSELHASDVIEVDGLRVTTPVRTAVDVARYVEADEAVLTIDELLNLRRVSIPEIRQYVDARGRSWRHRTRLTDVLAQVAEGAESPMETRLRLVLIRAGLPKPTLQHRVSDERGYPIARLDLAYVRQRVGIEYDGECHFGAAAVRKDLRRQNHLSAVGWTLFRFTAEDVLRHPGRLVAQVKAALAGTLWLPRPA